MKVNNLDHYHELSNEELAADVWTCETCCDICFKEYSFEHTGLEMFHDDFQDRQRICPECLEPPKAA